MSINESQMLQMVRARAAAKPLQSICRPWMEYQVLEVPDVFKEDCRVPRRGEWEGERMGFSSVRVRPSHPLAPDGDDDLSQWGNMLHAMVEVYKRHAICFRLVANAILHLAGIHETRPRTVFQSEYEKDFTVHAEDSMPVVAASGRRLAAEAIAVALHEAFVVSTDDEAWTFRSPLNVLIHLAFHWPDGQKHPICADELAVLYSLLVQGVGIPTRLVLEPLRGQAALLVEANIGRSRNGQRPTAVFDARKSVLSVIDRPMLEPNWGSDSRTLVYGAIEMTRLPHPQFVIPTAEESARTEYPRLIRHLVGRGEEGHEASRYWARPTAAPPWYPLFKQLEAHLRHQGDPDQIRLLAHPVVRGDQSVVGYNPGARTTAGYISALANLVREDPLYGRLVREISAAELSRLAKQPWAKLRGMDDEEKGLTLTRMIRRNHGYREETPLVEEKLTWKLQWRFQAFYPDVQRHDCDDLCTNGLTTMLAHGLDGLTRLAGSAGKTTKFHVFTMQRLPSSRAGRLVYRDAATETVNEIFEPFDHGSNYEDFPPEGSPRPNTEKPLRVRVNRVAAGWVRFGEQDIA